MPYSIRYLKNKITKDARQENQFFILILREHEDGDEIDNNVSKTI